MTNDELKAENAKLREWLWVMLGKGREAFRKRISKTEVK